MIELFKDLWQFLMERKKWWLAPIIAFILLLALLIFFGGSSAVAPFVYSIFQLVKKYFLKYQKSIIQIIGLIIGYLLFHKSLLLYLSLSLLFILILFPTQSVQITKYTDSLISLIGTIIKSVLLFFMFYFIIVPISVVYKLMKIGRAHV